MMKTIYTVRLNNGLTAPCDCNYVSVSRERSSATWISGEHCGSLPSRKQQMRCAVCRSRCAISILLQKYLSCSCSIFRPTVREWTLERRK